MDDTTIVTGLVQEKIEDFTSTKAEDNTMIVGMEEKITIGSLLHPLLIDIAK